MSGCTDEEVQQIQKQYKFTIPAIYVEFLKRMGRGAGQILAGTDVFYPEVLGLTEAAEEMMRREESSHLFPEDSVVFAMHQGYQFMYFRCSEGDDPPVYYYMMGDLEVKCKYPSFSNYLGSLAFSS